MITYQIPHGDIYSGKALANDKNFKTKLKLVLNPYTKTQIEIFLIKFVELM